jgi:sterol desaturase/sphingolipid hydroxylase (fatty acid hydroxylase superfamily)
MLEAYLIFSLSILSLPLLLFPLERLAPVERRQPVRRLLFNLLYGPFLYVFALYVVIASAPAFLFVIQGMGGRLVPVFGEGGAPILAQILFALAYGFVWDLSQYGFHRLQHASPFLWETHRFHHDETALNVATYTRSHPLAVLGVVLFNLPLAMLFGTQAPHAAAALVMFPLWGYFHHANLRLGFGPLTPVIAGPQYHRIHHSALPEHRDRNFANLFPIIDIAFGTYYRPGRDEYPPTGTHGDPVPSLRAATVQPFIAWWRMARVGRGYSAAMASGGSSAASASAPAMAAMSRATRSNPEPEPRRSGAR